MSLILNYNYGKNETIREVSDFISLTLQHVKLIIRIIATILINSGLGL